MLIEPSKMTRRDGGYRRRWFTDEDMDLYLWLDDDGELARVQLCYDRRGNQRVLSWAREHGYRHDRIDDGEGVAGKARTPILVLDGHCDIDAVLVRFRAAAGALDRDLFECVDAWLLGFTPPR